MRVVRVEPFSLSVQSHRRDRAGLTFAAQIKMNRQPIKVTDDAYSSDFHFC
jgi:hypothetical protein